MSGVESILSKILERLDTIESKIGGNVTSIASSSNAVSNPSEESPAIMAYSKLTKASFDPWMSTIESMGELKIVAKDLRVAWSSIGVIIDAASKSKKGDLTGTPYLLKPAQEAVGRIGKLRLNREYDNHQRAVMEFLPCLGWVMIDATSDPPSPSLFVKNSVGASDFYANKIRKVSKGKTTPADRSNIAFCDQLKALILALVAYTKEYHMSSLAWNNVNGGTFSDYNHKANNDNDNNVKKAPAAATTASAATKTTTTAGMSSIAAELAAKRSSAGNSAATGLRKVTKDQQTWRKEYKDDKAPSSSKPSPTKTVKSIPAKETPTSSPVFEYQNRGSKWVVEHHTKASVANNSNGNAHGLLTITATDPKQNVYLYKNDGITVDVKGKVNSVIIDNCTKTNVLFDTAISSCEIVNSRKIQVQTRGVCPSFAVDKTDGFTAYVTKETMDVTNFVTSKSSEMNVNYPVGDETKECPLPEQYRHFFTKKGLQSEVSDLYH